MTDLEKLWDGYYKANKDFVDKNCPELRKYNPARGYVGPNNNWLLLWLVPNTIYGVSVNRCGFEHDRRYQIGGEEEDRLEADRLFEQDISAVLDKSWLRYFPRIREWARRRTKIYYAAVLVGGDKCFNYHKDK